MLDDNQTQAHAKAERRLKKVKITLMRNPKFALWSGIMMLGKTSVDDKVPTACTNGRDERYGRAFIESLSDKELGFVVLHENLHKAFRHLFIWRKLYDESPQLANAACDYVINLMIVKMDPQQQVVAMPQKNGKVYGLLDAKYANMNAKQVFDLLKKQQEEQGDAGGDGEGEGQGGSGGGESFDDHDWDGAKELTEADRKVLEKEVDQALRQGMIAHTKLHGKGAGGMGRELGDLLEPKVDWRELLREFVKSICNAKDASSWRRVNRRYLSGDTYMPTLVGERVGRIAIGIDTSGSIGGEELNRFLSEVKSIADDVHPEFIDLIYWDSEVAAHEEYDACSTANIVSSTKPAGGGGTDPTAMMEYLKEKNITPECIIMLTDGYIGDWGNEWNAPILWAICNGASDVYAPCGKTVHIED
jgi:predicted metal-dependent peptidase